MILFYSEYCEHSKMLLDSIKRHDTNKLIKQVSVDAIRAKGLSLDPKIHSVPAMLFPKTNEVIFGKAVFDHLFLPGRGVLLMATNNSKERDTEAIIPSTGSVEPIAYTSSIIGQDFESLDQNDNKSDISFKWRNVGDNDVHFDTEKFNEDSNTKKLPSMEDIMKSRNIDDLWNKSA